MNSRMEKYDNLEKTNMSRTKKNSEIYSSLDMSELSRIKTNNNVSVISDDQKDIDIEKIKRFISSNNSEPVESRKRISLSLPEEEIKNVEREEEKDYDINSVLERARDKRETDYENDRHRKINNTEYDILKDLNIAKKKEKTEILENNEELNTEEKTIVELIQNISNKKENKEDLFKDLIGNNENTIVMAPIDEEINQENLKKELENITQELEAIKEPLNEETQELLHEKEANNLQINIIPDETLDMGDTNTSKTSIDKSFYTNSMTFNKSDFEGFDELEKTVKKNNLFTKIAILLIVLVLLATIFVILNYVLDLKII